MERTTDRPTCDQCAEGNVPDRGWHSYPDGYNIWTGKNDGYSISCSIKTPGDFVMERLIGTAPDEVGHDPVP